MSSESDTPKKATRSSLPFEPKRRKASDKKQVSKSPEGQRLDRQKQESSSASSNSGKTAVPQREKPSKPVTRAEMTIPDVVSRRMVKRMAILCGVPSFLGMFTFFVSYFVVTNDLFPLPNVAVVLVSMGFFGLGVLGLSYGVLSASWDEAVSGSVIGWNEFTTNFSRMTEAWRSAGKKS